MVQARPLRSDGGSAVVESRRLQSAWGRCLSGSPPLGYLNGGRGAEDERRREEKRNKKSSKKQGDALGNAQRQEAGRHPKGLPPMGTEEGRVDRRRPEGQG